MLNISTVVLGSTPIRTTSRNRSSRRRLFQTPTTPAPSQNAAGAATADQRTPQSQQSIISVTTPPGTMVIHIEESDEPRSGCTGVVLRATAGPQPSTLDVVWNNDGQIMPVLPGKLTLLNLPEISAPLPQPESQLPSMHSPVSRRGGHRVVLSTKLPKDLRNSCPLDSISHTEVEQFQIGMNNFLSAMHPKVRLLITGQFDSPLLDYAPYSQYMTQALAPESFVFDHANADQHIEMMRSNGDHQLADDCGLLLDNPPAYDGFRPCNNAVYFAMINSLKPADMYIRRDIIHGDGIRLRNAIWSAMTGDAGKSKKLMAMNMSQKISDIKYSFVRHGVAKYFTKVHTALAKLRMLGVTKQDWEIFSDIFHHMSSQCEEFRQVVSDMRDQLEKDEASVTLKLIERAFTRKETVHKLGIESKGTPLKRAVTMTAPPAVPVNAAKTGAPKQPPTNPQSQATQKSKLWPEMTAEANYGARGSHTRGQCKYAGHRDFDDHCWEGCSKCGGCKMYHKRRRMLDQGHQMCTVHQYSCHLESKCYRHKWKGRGRGRGRGRSHSRGRNNSPRSNDNRDRRNRYSNSRDRYPANSARESHSRRSRSRSRSRDRSRSKYSRDRKFRSHSPPPSDNFMVPINYIKPQYLRNMESFAKEGRKHQIHGNPSYPWSHGANRAQSSHDHHQSSYNRSSAHNAESDKQPFASAARTQHERRRNMGHIPHNDGTRKEFLSLIRIRNIKRNSNKQSQPVANRCMVASATQDRPQSRARTTLMDSGAGLTVVDDEDLYMPGSKRPFSGDVIWGDGSRKRIKFSGDAPAIGSMINTGGAAASNLFSTGAILDNLSKSNNRDFVMAFDRRATYLMRDATFCRQANGGFTLQHPTHPSAIMEAARRGPGKSGVYEVPLYDIQQSTAAAAHALRGQPPSFPLAAVKAMSSLPIYDYTPNWHRMPNGVTIFNSEIETPSVNASIMSRDIMRKHNAWGHPSPAVLKQMLMLKGTQRSKRLARKVDDLFQSCNGCLSGCSHKQPHSRDPEQPSSAAVRPMQHMMSDCLGKQNLAIATTPTHTGATIVYVVSCQYTKYKWLWLLQSTTDVTPVTEQYLRLVVRQRKRLKLNNDTEILTWRTDNGPDNPKALTDMLSSYGIDHQRTGAKASQQNGGAEAQNKVIEVKVRTQLAWAHAPRAWWGEASLYTCTTSNHTCSLSNENGMPPITLMYGRKPDFSKLHPFGCLAFIHIEKKARNGVLNKATHYGALMGYATGSDGRIISYRIYNYDTNRFVYPYDVTFNDDVPAIPYIASLRQLAPAVRLHNRVVRKIFNGTPYLGKVTHVRTDTDGERLYGVTYSDNDYEEYNFKQIMEILQPYNPLDEDDDVFEITPFFGSSKKHLAATDNSKQSASSTVKCSPKLVKQTPDKKSTRKSSRVRVVRRPNNVGSVDVGSIPSSLNRHRLRYAMSAQSVNRQESTNTTSSKPSLKRKFREAMLKRTQAFEKVVAYATKAAEAKAPLVPAVVIPPNTFVDTLPLPKSYEDAILGPYRNYWIPAIAAELTNLRNYGVWREEPLPEGVLPVKGKFVWKWKPDSNNHLLKAKVRFTMQGCRQLKGLHYKKTYAPVAYAQSIRLAVKLAVDLDYCIDVTDLEAAYLTADIEPDISLFIEPPPGIDVPDNWGLRLLKALYGSMQGAQRLDVLKHVSLENLGFKRMASETSVYMMPMDSVLGLVLLVTIVDDFVIIAKNRTIMAEIKHRLSTVWKITDQGPAKWVLNLRIRRDRPAGILKIDQQAYVEKKLREFGLEKLPGKKLPMRTDHKLSVTMCPTTPAEKQAASRLPYRSRTGSLNYLRLTRPDMSCCNSILSQFNKNYGQQHFDATTHAWLYAGMHKHWGLVMRKSGWSFDLPVNVAVYVDAGHASCPDTRRSRCGYFIKLNGDVVDFDCKLQPGVPAQSTAVAEYRAVTNACNAVIWLRSFLLEIGIKIREPVLFHEDNEACINNATNYMTTKRTKHVDIKHHVIRYWCKEDVIDFSYIDTASQLADIMTKCLAYPAFSKHRSQCMSDIRVNDVTGPFQP